VMQPGGPCQHSSTMLSVTRIISRINLFSL
jgi:hypothetical protein